MQDNEYRPRGLGTEGRKLWDSVVGPFELAPHERQLFVQACRTADLIADLDARIAVDGIVTATGTVSPLVIEARLQRLAQARLITSLRLPDEESGARPQHRGLRGVYPIGTAGRNRGA